MTTEIFLYSRRECHLCEELHLALEALIADYDAICHCIEIDGDPELMQRYGARVPVLVVNGKEICHQTADPGRIERYLMSPGH